MLHRRNLPADGSDDSSGDSVRQRFNRPLYDCTLIGPTGIASESAYYIEWDDKRPRSVCNRRTGQYVFPEMFDAIDSFGQPVYYVPTQFQSVDEQQSYQRQCAYRERHHSDINTDSIGRINVRDYVRLSRDISKQPRRDPD